MVGFSLSGTDNATIKFFVRTVRGMLSCIYLIYDVFLSRKVASTYDFGVLIGLSL